MKGINGPLLFATIATITLAALPLLSQDYRIPTLESTGNVAISSSDGSRLLQMSGTKSVVYLLVRSKTGSEVVRIDPRGGMLDCTPVHPRTLCLTVAQNGSVLTLRREGQQSIVSGPLWDPSQPSSERLVNAAIERLTTLGGKPAGVSDSVIRPAIDREQTAAIPIDVTAPHRTSPLPDGSLAIIASRQPTLWKLGADGRLSPPVKLVAPNLRQFQPPDTELAVIDVVTHESGELLLAASPYMPAEGARIVRFDANGKFRSALHLLMPKFSELEGIAGGRLSASKMAISGNRLFLGSSTSTALRIAYFDLDSQ